MPDQTVAGLALLGSAAAQTVRLARWCGTTTRREPLVLILPFGYAFILIGFSHRRIIGPTAPTFFRLAQRFMPGTRAR